MNVQNDNFGLGKKNLYENTVEDYFPLHNGLLLESVTVEEKTDSGIYLPDSVIESQKNTVNDSIAWKVVKCGPETVNIKPGDWVIFGRQTPIAVELEGKLYFQVFESWIAGLFRKNASSSDFKSSPILTGMPKEGSAIPTEK